MGADLRDAVPNHQCVVSHTFLIFSILIFQISQFNGHQVLSLHNAHATTILSRFAGR
jgi:hypothetical protein